MSEGNQSSVPLSVRLGYAASADRDCDLSRAGTLVLCGELSTGRASSPNVQRKRLGL